MFFSIQNSQTIAFLIELLKRRYLRVKLYHCICNDVPFRQSRPVHFCGDEAISPDMWVLAYSRSRRPAVALCNIIRRRFDAVWLLDWSPRWTDPPSAGWGPTAAGSWPTQDLRDGAPL